MLIDKPQCNFKNCRYCFDGNCVNASRYENCTMTDLHSEIARLRVDLDNVKADTVRKMQTKLYEDFLKIAKCQTAGEPNMKSQEVFAILEQIAKEMPEDTDAGT